MHIEKSICSSESCELRLYDCKVKKRLCEGVEMKCAADLNAVGEVVRWVDDPSGARMRMRTVLDSIRNLIEHIHVRRVHVHLDDARRGLLRDSNLKTRGHMVHLHSQAAVAFIEFT